MIHSLRATVTFTTPIKSTALQVDFEPQPGITAVIGRNGTGKSWSVLEVPRYLLFGKKALRGAAADYKTMEARGEFTLSGQRYLIERSAKRERITDTAGTILGVGADAVTAKVVELLGYGLDVFDLANASVQKQTDKLGHLRPAQRKELIDRVVGLADYETIEKACRAEATTLRRDAEALAKVLPKPGEAPVKPADYFDPAVTAVTLRRERRDNVARAALRAEIYRGMPPQRPDVVPPDALEMSRMEREEQERLTTEQERRRLNAILERTKMAPVGEVPEDMLLAAERRSAALRAIENRGPAPRYTREQSEAMWAAHVLADAYQPTDEVECPSCGTSFRPGGVAPPGCDVPKAELREDDHRRLRWANGEEIPIPPGPDLTDAQVKAARATNALATEYRAAEVALAALPAHVDQSEALRAAREAMPIYARYDAALEEHERRAAASKVAEDELARIGEGLSENDLEELEQQLRASEAYDRDLVAYNERFAEFERLTAEIEVLSARAEKFKEGGTALADARATLKAHLAPLWSRVASSLIFDMSAGELTGVVVDDDMEITVDGQRLETLSGAGETVANLALRIALGQVLVANSFPVFLGDEIDSDADEQRRAATKLAISSLGKRLSQIILVSHRQIDIADHVLDLDNTQ